MQVATGSDGKPDPLRYGIAICALSRYWINLYMPEMAHIYGYATYEMATTDAVAALKRAQADKRLSDDLPAIASYAQENAPRLREMIDEVIARRGLSLKALNMPQNPMGNVRGVLNISQGLYEGDPAQGLSLRDKTLKPRQEQMRAVMAELFAIDGFEPTLRTMIAGSFVRLMTDAQSKANPKLMPTYEKLPYGLRTSFASCAMHGSGGTIGTHALCLMMPAAVGAFGMAASPLIAVAIDRGLDWRQGNDFSWKRSASIAAFSMAVAFGINSVSPHDHLHAAQAQNILQQNKDVQDVMTREAHKRYSTLPDNLRARVDQQAAKKNLTPEIYLTICDGSDSLGRDIADFEKTLQAEKKTSWHAKLAQTFDL